VKKSSSKIKAVSHVSRPCFLSVIARHIYLYVEKENPVTSDTPEGGEAHE
jgi:hypothetical protein